MSAAPKAKVSVALSRDQRSDVAAAAVLRALTEAIEGNRDGAMTGEDPEFLHQLRIAVRRSRTVQRQLKAAFPPLVLPGYRSEFRWLQQTTGEARDLDVYLLGFEELRGFLPEAIRADLGPLRAVIGHWRLAAHAEASRALASRRTTELLTDWEMLLETLVELPVSDRPDATTPIARDRRAADPPRLPPGPQDGRGDRPRRSRGAPTTSCARRARSCATCSSCSDPSCSTPRWSVISSPRSRACRTCSAATRTVRSRSAC